MFPFHAADLHMDVHRTTQSSRAIFCSLPGLDTTTDDTLELTFFRPLA